MEKRIKAYLLLTEEWLQGKDKLSEQEREKFRQEYLVHLSFYQHERLVHLLVTILFAILTFILLIPYIRHYYFLENSVQKMYDLYEKL